MIIVIGLEDNGVIDWLTEGIVKSVPFRFHSYVHALVSAGIGFINHSCGYYFLKIVTQLQESTDSSVG
jgi:hypothetical protein